jgi:hypothetical protein
VRKIVCSLAVGALAAGCAAGHAAAAPPGGTAASRAPGGAAASGAPGGAVTSSPLGTVSGRAQLEGGPTPSAGAAGRRDAQPRVRPLPGTVEFELAGRTHRLVTATAGASGTFSVRLAPGTYRVTVRSPHIREQLSDGRLRELPCAPPRTVTVVARRAATITLTCLVP